MAGNIAENEWSKKPASGDPAGGRSASEQRWDGHKHSRACIPVLVFPRYQQWCE